MAHASRVEVVKTGVAGGDWLTSTPIPKTGTRLMELEKEAQASNEPPRAQPGLKTRLQSHTKSSPMSPPSWLGLQGKSQDSRETFDPTKP